MPFKYPTMKERILANSEVSSRTSFGGVPCRVWCGNVTKNRCGMFYGRLSIRVDGRVKKELVHRVVVRDVQGRRLTNTMKARHLCNNSLCVEETHIVGGTQKANIRQCVDEGRHGNAYRAPVREARTALPLLV